MSMNWSQYLLGKLAEEATEVAKEALKCQQQGVGSTYKGRPAIMELRNEFLECVAIIYMLETHSDVSRALGTHHINPVSVSDMCQDDDYIHITHNKVLRLCYYAMFAYQSNNLYLTEEEFNQVKRKAQSYVLLTGKPSVDPIVYMGVPEELHKVLTAMGATVTIANVMAEVRKAIPDPLAVTKAQVSVGSDIRNDAASAPGLPDESVEHRRRPQ